MNFKKLQAMQAKLDEAILADKAPMTAEERFNKTLVALSVEIAEIANCAEHFKFWKDNKGKFDNNRFSVEWDYEGMKKIIDENNGDVITIEQAHRLTLIEECSDALHFILSLANQIEHDINLNQGIKYTKEEMYLLMQSSACLMMVGSSIHTLSNFNLLVNYFFSYVSELGISEKELEQAYYDKNKINYERLENGY